MSRPFPCFLTALLATLVLASAARAATFVETFDDGTIDASLSSHANPSFAVGIEDQHLELSKTAGRGNGEALLRSDFVVGGDFSASAIVERADLSGAAELGIRGMFQDGTIAEIFFAGTDTSKAAIDDSVTSEAQNAASATLRIRRTGNEIACEIDTGSGFVAKNSATSVQLGKAKVRFEWFLRQTGGSTVAHDGHVDTIAIDADVILGGGGGPTATPVTGPTPTPRETPADVDHFSAYAVKVAKGTAPFVPLGPVSLPRVAGGSYDVQKVGNVLLPADVNAAGVHDPAIHLLEYAIKPAKGQPKFAALPGTHVLNQCSDLFVTLGKPVSVLVPTAKDLQNPVTAPVSPPVDHFLCFAAKLDKKAPSGAPLAKFPKGVQVDVADQFETRRYELTKVSKLCLPTAKSGSPLFLKGAAKGTPAPLAPAAVQHANEHLFCYKAKLASAHIEQLGCGPATPGDKGTKIVPKQSKHTPRLGFFVANQLGTLQLDSKKEVEVCVPSFAELPII